MLRTMRTNVGTSDRLVRFLLAALLIGLFAAGVITGPLGWIGLGLGVILVITGITRVCPLYLPFGIRTSQK
jgi:Flp pilus assembly protein TadB